jgi:putative ABC transport system permease protein
MRIDLNFTKYAGRSEKAAFWRAVDERLRAIPGVIDVGAAGVIPFNEQRPYSNYIHVEGREAPDTPEHPRADVRIVSPGYFAALGQPVLEGRPFTDDELGDGTQQPAVIVINQTMARHYWPNESALGKRISGDGGEHWARVVGIVADTRQHLDEAPGDEIYIPMTAMLSTNWLVRNTLDESRVVDEIKAAVQGIDPDQPVDRFRTLSDVRRESLAPPRLTAILLGLFAALALLVTATGIAGVVAFSVNQRTQEFGIRMALGAGRGTVLAMVLEQGLRYVLTGLAIGAVGALILTRVMTTLLFGVEPTDVMTFLSVALVLVAVAVIACLVPARRAASVDPLVALRVG